MDPPALSAGGDTSTRDTDTTTGRETIEDDTLDTTGQTPHGDEQGSELSTAINLLTILSSSLDLEVCKDFLFFFFQKVPTD